MNEISFLLKKYRFQLLRIDGVETHIIDSQSMEAMVNDRQLLDKMNVQRKYIMPYIDVISSVREVKLYLGLLHNVKLKAERWFPVLCMRWNNGYYHVCYKDGWRCLHCGHVVERVLMPLSECSDRVIAYTADEIPPEASLFQKINCPKCGSMLQNHLMLLGQYF